MAENANGFRSAAVTASAVREFQYRCAFREGMSVAVQEIMRTDPVCGMQLDTMTAFAAGHNGETFWFCSERCRNRFVADPQHYAVARASQSSMQAGPLHKYAFVAITAAFLVIALWFLVTEHRAHFFGALPFALILACPLLHLLMHRGHRHEH